MGEHVSADISADSMGWLVPEVLRLAEQREPRKVISRGRWGGDEQAQLG